MRFNNSDWDHRDIQEILQDMLDTLEVLYTENGRSQMRSLIQEVKVKLNRLQEKIDYAEDIEANITRRNELNIEIEKLEAKLKKAKN